MSEVLVGSDPPRRRLARGSAGLRDGATRAERGIWGQRLEGGSASLRGVAADAKVFA